MNHALLRQKLQSIEALSSHNGDTATRFGEHLEALDDWHLLRINPLRFASQAGLQRRAALDYFVLGVKVGLFDFVWHTVCPWCGSVSGRCDSFEDLSTEPFFCLFCHAELPRTMDTEVETAFTINPEIKELKIDPFRNRKSYWRYFFSPNARVPRKLRQFLDKIVRGYHSVAPDEVVTVQIPGEPGEQYRLLSLDRHSTLFLNLSEAGSDCKTEVDLLPAGFSTQETCLPAGSAVHARNLGQERTGFLVLLNDEDEFHDVLLHNPVKPIPYLTGKMLLNHQTFRDVFRMETLRADLKLDIRSVVLLFTDLKGSTQLYDRCGDSTAYQLIQEHFKELGAAVIHHRGAIVKTMGDAVMASFSSAEDGLAAALEMLERIDGLNQRLGLADSDLGLNVGLHQGPTLAVNANDALDYFGQTVNVAARVQGLAQAGEIWFTEPLRRAVGKAARGQKPTRRKVRLRGVDQETVVYRL